MRSTRHRHAHLHSTMYLLNPVGLPTLPNITVSFTFHYVSIKSCWSAEEAMDTIAFTFHYVSIKSKARFNRRVFAIKFTFHYVSIKSQDGILSLAKKLHLHSTMYLLNQLYSQQRCAGRSNLHSTMYLLNRHNAEN